MKTTKKKVNRLRAIFYLTFILLFTIAAKAFSQDHYKNINLPEKAKANYIGGIVSTNPGVKSSSIYFAGRYEITEAGKMLVEELKKTKEEDIILLLAWSIYRIGEECCINELQEIAANHKSKRLKTFCAHLNQQKDFENAYEFSK